MRPAEERWLGTVLGRMPEGGRREREHRQKRQSDHDLTHAIPPFLSPLRPVLQYARRQETDLGSRPALLAPRPGGPRARRRGYVNLDASSPVSRLAGGCHPFWEAPLPEKEGSISLNAKSCEPEGPQDTATLTRTRRRRQTTGHQRGRNCFKVAKLSFTPFLTSRRASCGRKAAAPGSSTSASSFTTVSPFSAENR
jgi:hypothetical protein